jgi:hypothetical protein
MLIEYSENRSNKVHIMSPLFENNEITVSDTKKEAQSDGQIVDSGVPFSSDPILPSIADITFIERDENETFNGKTINGVYTYPQNNIHKITDAIKDIYDLYVVPNTSLVGYLDFNSSNVNIKIGNDKRTDIESSIYRKVKEVIYNDGTSYNPDDPKFTEAISKTLNKYYVFGTVDSNKNLVNYQVCKIYDQTEASSRDNGVLVGIQYNGVNYDTSDPLYRLYDTYKSWSSVWNISGWSYNYKYTYIFLYKIKRLRNITDGPVGSSPYTIYPFICFNRSNLPKVFNELKNQYVKCIENISTGINNVKSIDNLVESADLQDMYKEILSWKSKEIKDFNDIKWLYDKTQSLWTDKIRTRVNVLFDELNVSEEHKKEIHSVLKSRINKDDGTLWTWYKDILSTDMMLRKAIKKNKDLEMFLKKMAVWKLMQNTDGTQFVYVEENINSYYSVIGYLPQLSVGKTIQILDDNVDEQEAIIKNITYAYIETVSETQDPNALKYGIVNPIQKRVLKIECDRQIGGVLSLDQEPIIYDKDLNGRVCMDLLNDNRPIPNTPYPL